MLWISLQQVLLLIALVVLFTFEKVAAVPLLSFFVVAYLATRVPPVIRIGLVLLAGIFMAGLFALPAYLAVFIMGVVAYSWIAAERFANKSNIARVLVVLLAILIWMLLVGTTISIGIVLYVLICTVVSWYFLERTQYAL